MTQTTFFHTTFGFTNCNDLTLIDLMNILIEIDPDVIRIDTPYRPRGENFVKAASVDEPKILAKDFEDHLGKKEGRHRLWVFGVHNMHGMKVSWRKQGSISHEIMELIKRRPCRVVDIANILAISYR